MVYMNSKEIGFLFRIALSCALDSTKIISAAHSNEFIGEVLSLILKHIDLVDTEDIMKMHSMAYSYYSGYADIDSTLSIATKDYIQIYEQPRKSEKCKAFSELLLDELKKRTNE